MKRAFILQSLVVLVTLLWSCTQEKPPGRNLIVLIDFSSSRDTTTLDWYRQIVINSILGQAASRDRIIILPIDKSSELWSQEIFKLDFTVFKYGNEYSGLQKEEVEHKNFKDTVKSAVERFNSAFHSIQQQRAAFTGGTDVLGALKLCRKYFSKTHENIIVILSDMRQYVPGSIVNLEGSIVSKAKVDTSLAHTDAIDLNHCKIVVLTGAQTNISIEQYNIIKHFWELFFEKSSATLVDYSTGAVTKLEELVTTKK